MTKPYLFFDFDGFLFYTVPPHAAYLNHKYQIHTVDSDYIGNPDLDELVALHTGVTRPMHAVYEDVGHNFHTSVYWHRSALPIHGMCDVVPKLAERYRIVVVTARSTSGRHVIQYLTDKYVPGCIHDIHCVHHWDGAKFVMHSKRDYIASIEGEKIAFIDDSPKEIFRMEGIIPSYLYDEKGLHAELQDIPARFANWYEIGNTFLK